VHCIYPARYSRPPERKVRQATKVTKVRGNNGINCLNGSNRVYFLTLGAL